MFLREITVERPNDIEPAGLVVLPRLPAERRCPATVSAPSQADA